MSLLLIVRKVWRYKLATLPILAFVLAGAVYVIAVRAPTYEAGSTYIMVNPPAPPSDAQIARDPALARVKADNPYMRFSDQSVLVQVLASRLQSEETRRSLAAQGADPTYIAEPSAEFGFSAPILQITGTGTSPAAAVKTADLVGLAMSHELERMQQGRGIDKKYWITTQAVVAAHDAKLKASGKLRALVAVFVLGAILLFIVMSVGDAVSTVRAEWKQVRIDEEDFLGAGSFEPLLTLESNGRSPSDPEPDAREWPLEAQR